MNILLTGFEPFGNFKINPSQVVIETIAEELKDLAHINIKTHILPTEYDKSGTTIQTLIDDFNPHILLCLGVSGKNDSLNFERVALNIDDATLADNADILRTGEKIIRDGPLAYFSNYPLNLLKHTMEKADIPIKISNHAGTYVCNHVYYMAQHHLSQNKLDSLCGFLHIPDFLGKPIKDVTLPSVVEILHEIIAVLMVHYKDFSK